MHDVFGPLVIAFGTVLAIVRGWQIFRYVVDQ